MAMGGWMSPSGDADRPPVRCSVEQAYLQAGAQAAAAVMIAYCQREQTDAGSYIDLSIHEAVLNSLIGVVSMYQHDKSVQKRTALATFNHLVRRPSFRCKDGYIAFRYYTGRGMGSQMKSVIEWMKEEGKAQELATFDFEQRKLTDTTQAESDRWDQVFAEFFIKYTKKEIYQQALKRRFMMFPVNTMADILRDDQLAARRFFVAMPAPSLGGDLLFPGAFVHMSETPVAFRRLAPKVGEHNEEILGKELGLTPQEIGAMGATHDR
jgi:crotonobetainyl-CoA:carnitine CoA-transferase CaiB-like acyl-CoA transferase